MQRPARAVGGARIVRDHHDRLAVVPVERLQQGQDLVARFAIEVAGRLVAQQQRRVGDNRAGDADALLLTKLGSADRRKRVQTALSVVGLADRASHYPRQLSGGQEQRVGIARAIVTDPTLLLCDEPTGDLDRKSGDEVLNLLQTLNRDYGKTIVMVTHDPRAAECARRTLHLEKGLLVAEQEKEAVRA